MKDRKISGKIIPNEDVVRTSQIQEPTARIDIRFVPYDVYKEYVKECSNLNLSYKQLFIKLWESYKHGRHG